MPDHVFISYSDTDALEFATKLADELEGGHPYINVWIDKRDLKPGMDWDAQVPAAIRGSKCVVFVVTEEGTAEGCTCKDEWTWGLKYKKPVLPLRLHASAELPFRLSSRQDIDFSTNNFEAGLAKLRKHLAYLDSEEGKLDELKHRLADANRDLKHARPEDRARIQSDVDDLISQIKQQEDVVKNPKAAQEQTQKNIEAGLERERQPVKPTAAQTTTKFINPPPGIAPNYFQDRLIETRQVVDFLNDNSQRLMTIIGRGGVGKTAMICRLLKGIENGQLPDDLGEMKAEGIVYLSEAGSHRVNFANIFYDLCKLLPSPKAQDMDAIYKNPQASTESKMRALLDLFTAGQVILLLDNIETIINVESFDIGDAELNECLHAFLHGSHSAVKIVMTTRIAPRGLNLYEPGRQRIYHLEEGLPSPYAERMLREIDTDGTLGLKDAKEELLNRARIKTRGFPKGLEALKQILASDRYTTLEELIEMPLPENVVEALVGEAFNRLDTNAQKVMQALAVYNRPVTPAAVDFLLAPHIPAMDSAPILQRLTNMHFARKESGRFYLHPVDREFAFGLIGNQGIRNQELGIRKQDSDSPQSLIPNQLIPNHQFTQHDLLSRAADYFAQARKPRAEWKKLDDLAAQLAEFDLRCAAGDYDTATSVLLEIDFNYLLLWGHYRLMIDLHGKLQEKINDTRLAQESVGNLGTAYKVTGNVLESIRCYERAVNFAKHQSDKQGEEQWLMGIGNCYTKLGDTNKAIEYYQQALTIAHAISDKKDEGKLIGNIGNRYIDLGDYVKAIEYYKQELAIFREIRYPLGEAYALANNAEALLGLENYDEAIINYQHAILISDELSSLATQQYNRFGLAQAYLFQNDLVNVRATIEAALQYDEPENNHNATTLHGIITLRQGDTSAARQSFTRAIAQADEILAKTPEYYSALDAKGLALCGLILCRGAVPAPGDLSTTGRGDPAPTIDDAIATFKKAREIAPHAGVVKSVLRLFDELVKCDEDGVLKDVRKAVEGT
ncbi:MAG: tetratricopeptide repeat protein [Chloroflexota bacterium]